MNRIIASVEKNMLVLPIPFTHILSLLKASYKTPHEEIQQIIDHHMHLVPAYMEYLYHQTDYWHTWKDYWPKSFFKSWSFEPVDDADQANTRLNIFKRIFNHYNLDINDVMDGVMVYHYKDTQWKCLQNPYIDIVLNKYNAHLLSKFELPKYLTIDLITHVVNVLRQHNHTQEEKRLKEDILRQDQFLCRLPRTQAQKDKDKDKDESQVQRLIQIMMMHMLKENAPYTSEHRDRLMTVLFRLAHVDVSDKEVLRLWINTHMFDHQRNEYMDAIMSYWDHFTGSIKTNDSSFDDIIPVRHKRGHDDIVSNEEEAIVHAKRPCLLPL